MENHFKVCPDCGNRNIVEYTEPASEVANVYIYDLGSGPQTELDGLLAQGYVIQNRYSKQYHLEKPKEVAKAKGADPDDNQAFMEETQQ